jgi:predicted MPP superfamily phosphohydrolase
VCGYGVLVRRRWFVTRRVDIPIAGLDKRLDGYKIVQLSDLHIGALTPPSWGARWVRRANEENADAVVVTGDMVTSGIAYHDDIGKLVGGLRGKDGVFVSMGNHDYFGEGEPLVTRIVENGARVLRNEGLEVERDGARLYLAAVDDTWTRRANLERALEGRPEGMPTVLLAHDPDRFPQYVKKNVDLVLAGHTHGGQIAVPFLARHVNASKLAHHYHLGVYKEGKATLYVHPGLGTTGPPIRLGVAPAIVVLTLRAA